MASPNASGQSPPPPSPLPLPPQPPAANPADANTSEYCPFARKGTTKDDTVFEFPRSSEASGRLLLRSVVGHYLSAIHQRSFQAQQLYLILGRLRYLQHMLESYNRGLVKRSSLFQQYLRPQTLNYLSSFGFHTESSEPIAIDGLKALVNEIEAIFESDIVESRSLIKAGVVSFDGLAELYKVCEPVQAHTNMGGALAVFQVTESHYEERRSLLGKEKSFHITMEFVTTIGNSFTLVSFTEVLSGWNGLRARPIASLTYVPLEVANRQLLQERGEVYVEYSTGGAKFLAYSPFTFFMQTPAAQVKGSRWLSRPRSNQNPAGGRIMVDTARGASLGYLAATGADEATLALKNAFDRYHQHEINNRGGAKARASLEFLPLWETVPQELILYCWPFLVGFSFPAKAWGQVLVSGIEPIQFYEKSFDRLVLPESQKKIIRALVRFGAEANVDDVVGGKRGGSVFLLHGPPGVGKTLTAEAIAELLHCPLYSITMGELGTDPQALEDRLGDILELCAEWNAVALLDEADIFLEERSGLDMVQHAMVCVMLRLLEYHPGILFLTTNRVRNFDPAIESRVTVALNYEPLNRDARARIWKTMLDLISMPVHDSIDIEHLAAAYAINGRDIKTAVRLAVALAKDQRLPMVTYDLLEAALQTASIGRRKLSERPRLE